MARKHWVKRFEAMEKDVERVKKDLYGHDEGGSNKGIFWFLGRLWSLLPRDQQVTSLVTGKGRAADLFETFEKEGLYKMIIQRDLSPAQVAALKEMIRNGTAPEFQKKDKLVDPIVLPEEGIKVKPQWYEGQLVTINSPKTPKKASLANIKEIIDEELVRVKFLGSEAEEVYDFDYLKAVG